MEKQEFNQGLLEFIQASPTPFHATANLAAMLENAGFEELFEQQSWQLESGKGYFVIRNDSAIVAFRIGSSELLDSGLAITGAHTDSPCLKVKPNPDIREQGYLQLGVEVYGGALLNPWYDRDLSLAGRVDYQTEDGQLDSCIIDLEEPVAVIPSLAIHLDRGVNDGRKVNPQTQMPPILMQLQDDQEFTLDEFLLGLLQGQEAFADAAKLLSHELFFYDTQAPAMVGLQQQFIAAARLDNLLSCYVNCQALINSAGETTAVLVCNDHEEVGSTSSSGAQGPFLKRVLERMVSGLTDEPAAFDRVLSQSVFLSVDNAHGIHPNFIDKHDAQHQPKLNSGPVIKLNANQRYASNSNTVALFKALCDEVGVAYQAFVVRADMGCGSTIGPITAAELGIATLDVGVPTFAMHSIREMAGADDAYDLTRVVVAFYNS